MINNIWYHRKLFAQADLAKLKVAVIGQSQFGADVYQLLRNQQHQVVGVFTIPDVQGKPDILGI